MIVGYIGFALVCLSIDQVCSGYVLHQKQFVLDKNL